MLIKADKNTIKQLLLKGNLEAAITCFLELTKKFDPSLYNQGILQSANFNSARTDYRKQLISSDEVSKKNAKTTYFMTELVDELNDEWEVEVDIPEPVALEEQKKVQSTTRKILFLAANPKDMEPLRFDKEAAKIEDAIQRSAYREKFDFKSRFAVQIRDMRRTLIDNRNTPVILHFSGHGSNQGKIMFENPNGDGKHIPATALGNFFRSFPNVECVVLNACYAAKQADEIAKNVNYVIGMNDRIEDKAALEFSEAFYDAIGAEMSYEEAFNVAADSLFMYNINTEDTPVLIKKTLS
jgi:hypothetical protein